MVFGSAAVGAIIASTLTSYFDDHLLEIPITTIVARGSYLLTRALDSGGACGGTQHLLPRDPRNLTLSQSARVARP